MNVIDKARVFAMKAHGEQKYGFLPYIYHLDAVLEVLIEFRCDDQELFAAAYLHDVLEDTAITRVDMALVFGENITRIVADVTNAPGKNRAERADATYPKIRSSVRAVQLKLADRIANCRASIKAREFGNDSLIRMYRKEYPSFRTALFRDGEFPAMWAELDRLCLTRERGDE